MSQQAAQALGADPALAPYVEEFGPLALDPVEDTFERLVVSLLRQQVSIDAAAAIQQRLFDAFEITPEAMLAADETALRDVGLSEAKTEYVKHVARAYQEYGYNQAYFAEMDDEAVVAELTEIRGVGPWTAKMFLLFALGRPDVFPVEDLGVRRGMEIVCDREMTRGEMRQRAGEWAPYRSYASLYLWRAYEG
jgi:DNA-3-methyladenine glycosylase II